MPENNQVQILPPNTNLKKKIGERVSLSDIFTPAKIEAASRAIEASKAEFIVETRERLARAVELFNAGDMGNAEFREMMECAFYIKSHAGMSGYLLATVVANLLFTYMEKHAVVTADVVKVLEAHMQALQGIFTNNIRADGGQLGVELVESLTALQAKFG
jgi:hypothetical protein